MSWTRDVAKAEPKTFQPTEKLRLAEVTEMSLQVQPASGHALMARSEPKGCGQSAHSCNAVEGRLCRTAIRSMLESLIRWTYFRAKDLLHTLQANGFSDVWRLKTLSHCRKPTVLAKLPCMSRQMVFLGEGSVADWTNRSFGFHRHWEEVKMDTVVDTVCLLF
jgi:hypothetical protein